MSWQKTTAKVAGAIAVLSGLWMALTVGITDVFNIIARPDEVSAATAASLNGIDFIDRIAVLGVLVTVLGSAGLGVITVSRDNPEFVNTSLTFLPVIVGFLAFTAFGSEVIETLTGDRDWGSSDDVANSYILFLAASLVAGLVQLLENRRRM